MTNRSKLLITALLLMLPMLLITAQEEDLVGGVQLYDESSADGYVLYSPTGLTGTYLIDKQGQVINAWDSDYAPASAMYLTDEGHLIRAGRKGSGPENPRVIEEYDWEGNLVWQYVLAAPNFSQHHDIQPMPNGNILLLAWEYIPLEEAIQLGFQVEGLDMEEPLTEIRMGSIFEINPDTDAIVWEWHTRDHLVQDVNPDLATYGEIADFPRRINLNYHDVPDVGDITHMNSIVYHAARDEVMMSVRSFSEVWVIDHSLSTEEARGSAGDLLYRWGNPQAYGQGTQADRILYYQHDARWLDDNDPDSLLTVFSNGSLRHEIEQSYLIKFAFPEEWMTDDNQFQPVEIVWQSETDLFAVNMSGGQSLANNHALITLAPDGRFVEITEDSDIVWDYISPIYRETNEGPSNRVFRAAYYEADFAGFVGKNLQPQGILQTGIR